MFKKIIEHINHYRVQRKYFSFAEFIFIFILFTALKNLSFFFPMMENSIFHELTSWDILIFSILSAYIYGITRALSKEAEKTS